MKTTLRTVIKIHLENAAKHDAKASGVDWHEVLTKYQARYADDPAFRRLVQEAARLAMKAADPQRGVDAILRCQAQAETPSPDRVDDLEEILREANARDLKYHASVSAIANYTQLRALKERAQGKVPPPEGEPVH